MGTKVSVRVDAAERDAGSSEKSRLLLSGYRCIGSGYFSSAYAHPDRPDEVVKVGRYDTRDQYDGSGPPPDGWLSYVLDGEFTSSPHAPRVHEVELRRDHYVARMERLSMASTPEQEGIQSSCWGRRECPSHHAGSLGDFGRALEHWPRVHHGYLDCHGDNLMFRKDGTPVITDPFVMRRSGRREVPQPQRVPDPIPLRLWSSAERMQMQALLDWFWPAPKAELTEAHPETLADRAKRLAEARKAPVARFNSQAWKAA